MSGISHVAVIDIGKTNAKVALVDLESMAEIAVRKATNRVSTGGPYPHHDVDGLWKFILDSLAALHRERSVDAISVTTHGATAALLGEDGSLALPVLDYEFEGPDQLEGEYAAVRPRFTETGSPRLPLGLNLGAQLFWQQRQFPDAFASVRSILMYPQYWAFRLSGVAASEVTSLGCHTDLWNPLRGDFSSLVDRMGWRTMMAPTRAARDRLGPVLPEIAQRAGLGAKTPVFCGIHDSNASLLPHVLSRRPPFAVVSTGTWVISMAIGGSATKLDPARDTLINVNALDQPVPSARFMGGREYALLTEGLPGGSSDADVASVLGRPVLLLPSVQAGSGPFPGRQAKWIPDGGIAPGEREAAAAFYLAMMTATCLELVGAGGDTVVEGPFADNRLYCRMLAVATGRRVATDSGGKTGTSIGAALLAADTVPHLNPGKTTVDSPGEAWSDYTRAWRAALLS